MITFEQWLRGQLFAEYGKGRAVWNDAVENELINSLSTVTVLSYFAMYQRETWGEQL